MIKIYFETDEMIELDLETLNFAQFEGRDFHRAIFDNQEMICANFHKALLRNTLFINSTLDGADFSGAKLMGALFENASLKNSNFTDSMPIDANFKNANLINSIFKGADLFGASFQRADLRGANLIGCERINETDFQSTIFDEHTLWPHDFDPVAHGAIFLKQS